MNLTGFLRSVFGFARREKNAALPFESILERFKAILVHTGSALEIISDMGEKLSGDYIFDINYIKNGYSELSTAVHNSMQEFDVLTHHRYPKLHDALDRIDGLIKGMISDEAPKTGTMVVFFENIVWDMQREVGGKNANIAELKNNAKLNVPEGFAITTRAFDEFIRHNRLEAKIGSPGRNTVTESALDGLQHLIINAEVPPELNTAIDNAIEKIRERCRQDCFIAARSSAEEEDGAFSFAGQFETVLNVPLEGRSVKDAYKKVVASLYSARALAYQKHLGYEIGKLKMAVGCMAMIDAVSSGVIYSVNPDGDSSTMIINAAWGLGSSIVEGQIDADSYVVSKGDIPEIIDEKCGSKDFMVVNVPGGGTKRIETPHDVRNRPCLTERQVKELAIQAMKIEKHFGKPQDIEWAIDRNGVIVILQARSMWYAENTDKGTRDRGLNDLRLETQTILMSDKGIAVQRGIGSGRVFILRHMDELDRIPKGAVLVAKHDSSNFVRVMPSVAAIITDIGTPTSHMASICRELRVPTAVNAGDATQLLKHGQEVTVDVCDEGAVTVYEGIARGLIGHADSYFRRMGEIYEFRKKRYILRYISTLNLINPLEDNFTPEGCKTIHDILRFMHEKSVSELISNSRAALTGHAPVRLDLKIPTGIVVIDIGGALGVKTGQKRAAFDDIASIPLKAVIGGMLYPGVWHSDMVALKAGDFLTSMMRMPDITTDGHTYTENNVAVASREYMNLSLRFGYHFNVIDCYCSENARDNHIYFRFAGGATDIVKRSRRVHLIADILKEYGFSMKTKGDLIIARLADIRQDEAEKILDLLGRLIAYTRQMDAVLHGDDAVERYARNFLEGKYEF